MNRIVTVLLVLFLSAVVHAQEFDTHAVKRGETLESIARKYQVGTSDIIRLNPEVKNGLTVNSILIIPISDQARKEGPEMTQEVVSFITHKVRRKETLFSIARLYNVGVDDIKRYNKELYGRQLKKREKIRVPRYEYKAVEVFKDPEPDNTKVYTVQISEGKWRVAYKHGITIEELEKLNPDMGDVLKPGQELLVPDSPEQPEKEVDDTHNYYVVQPKEGFYRLKVKLGVTKEELEALNPELGDGGLKAGMILKLPKDISGNFEVEDGMVTESFHLEDSIRRGETASLALVLPLRLNEMGGGAGYAERLKGSKLLSRSLDFYTGALAALDTARQMGISVNLNVLDSRGDVTGVGGLLAANEFRTSDAIIGPFLSKPFNEVVAGVKHIPAFLPFSGNIRSSANVFQTVPDDNVLQGKMLNFLRSGGEDKEVIIIADSKNAAIRATLQQELPGAKILSPTEDKYIRLDDLKKLLSDTRENRVIVETNDIVLLTNVTGILNSARSDKHRIVMFTTKKGSAYDAESISNFHLANLNFHYPAVDKASSENNVFSQAYEKKFGISPNRYAVRGYDLTLDVILRLAYNKDLFDTASKIGETEYVENKFKYHRKSQGEGFYNNGAYIVRYTDNLEIEEAGN